MGGSKLERAVKALAAPHKISKRMTRDHVDTLQNIEFALVTCHRENEDIDDRVCAEALVAAIRGEVAENPSAQLLAQDLQSIRETRPPVGDDVWRDGLRVVLASVRLHSTLKSGMTGYLDFVSQFIH